MISRLRIDRHTGRAAIATAAAAVVMVPLVAGPAQAAPVTVTGIVNCIYTGYSVGVWVDAKTSRPGFAKLDVSVTVIGDYKYSYKLNKGGSYSLHVGCGGTKKNWKLTAKSGTVSGKKNNFRCNDIPPGLSWPKKAGILAMFDLSDSTPYKSCKRY